MIIVARDWLMVYIHFPVCEWEMRRVEKKNRSEYLTRERLRHSWENNLKRALDKQEPE